MDPQEFERLLQRGREAGLVPTEGAAPTAQPAAPAPEAAPEIEVDGEGLMGAVASFFGGGSEEEAPELSADEQNLAIMRGEAEGPFPEKPLGDPTAPLEAGVGGALKSVFETKDFLFGDTPQEDRSGFRAGVEDRVEYLSSQSMLSGFSAGIGQFAGAMVGLGKVAAVARALPWVGRGLNAAGATTKGKIALETGKAATAGAIAFDPHEERLSNLIQDTPLANPLTDFLAANPDDSAALGRAKAAMESIGLDAAIIGTFLGSAKVWKHLRNGDTDAASRAVDELETEAQGAQLQNANEGASPAPTQEGDPSVPQAGAEPDDAMGGGSGASVSGDTPGDVPSTGNPSEQTVGTRVATPSGEDLEVGAGTLPKSGLVVANRYANGKVYIGKRGDLHFSISERHPFSERGGPVDTGFVSPDGTYLTRAEALEWTNRNGEAVRPAGNMGNELDAMDYREQVRNPQAGQVDVEITGTPTQAAEAAGVDLASNPLPSAAPRIRMSDEDTTKVLEGLDADASAMASHGGWYQAIEAGHTFGKGEGIPYVKLNSDAAVDDFMARVVDAAEERLDSLKGGSVLTDARVTRLVDQRRALFDDDPAALLGLIQQSGKNAARMVADMEAGYLVSARMMQDAYTLASRINMGDFSQFGSKDAAVDELKKRLSLSASIYGASRSMTANAGRAVRRMRKDFRLKPEDVEKLRDMDGDTLAQLMVATQGNPRNIAKLANPSIWSKTIDFGQYLLINSLVSGPKTQLINALTNGYMVGARPLERILGGTYQTINGDPAGRALIRENLKQYTYMRTAFTEGFQFAVKAFKANDSIIAPHQTELYTGNQNVGRQVGSTFKKWDSLPNLMHNALVGATTVIGVPTRVLGTVDELVKQTVYRSKLMSMAHIEAAEKAAQSGLTGKPAKDFIRQFVTDKVSAGFDELGRGTNPEALREANIATFQQDLLPGTFGKWVNTGTATLPVLKLVLPFVKTPTNVIRYGWKMSPGLNVLQTEYRDMLTGRMGKEAQAQAIGQMSIGGLFMGAAATMVADGLITGGGPSDWPLQEQLRATGWQPYSVVIENDGGTKTYVPFNRYDPIAIPFGIVSDLQDAITRLDAESPEDVPNEVAAAIAALGMALAKQFTTKTYLTGINAAMDAMNDPENRGRAFVNQTVANFIPYSAAMRQLDPQPYLLEARDLTDKLMATIPGMSQNVPPKYDAWGDPILARKGLWSTDNDQLVDRETQRLIVESGGSLKRVSPRLGDVDLRDVTTEDGKNAYEEYQRLSGRPTPSSEPLKDVVAKVMASPAYQRAPDGDIGTRGTKLWLLSAYTSKYRNAASKLIKSDPNVREALMTEQQRVLEHYDGFERRPAAPASSNTSRPSIGEGFGVDLGGLFEGQQ